MNTNLQRARREIRKIQRVDDDFGLTKFKIVLDFTRPGKEKKYFTLREIIIPRKLAKELEGGS